MGHPVHVLCEQKNLSEKDQESRFKIAYPPCALFVVGDELKVEVLLRRRHRHLDHLLRLLRQVSQHLEKSERDINRGIRNPGVRQ